ncbi:DNA primase [Candidatus Parcubacteria bacterium]|nr:DNA primase [Candidatus Parcubacteria bacterium]
MNQVEEVKSRLDIVDVVSGYISLQQAGGNFRANCPFHNEKTPSFMVSKEKQIWHCFGCDKGGDVISFVQEHEGIEFKEALRILAERANVPMTGFSFDKKQDHSGLYEINDQALKFYHNLLMQDGEVSKKLKKYLDNRKITKGSIENWQLGLSGESWDGLFKYLISEGYKESDIFQAGLILKKKDGSGYVDRFRKRLMFPIHDAQGRVVAFTSRTLTGIAYDEEEFGGKYINSPQSAIYDKSKILYGWHLAKNDIRKKKYLIAVEGNMDVIASHQTSSKNTVAVSGTALTAHHLKLIKRYTNNIILAFDGDAAGSRAAFRSIALGWQNEMNIKILLLPKDKDPADIVKKDYKDWLSAIKNSIPVMDYYFRRIFAGIDLNRADHKKIAVQKLLPIIKFLKSNIEQIHYLQILSEKLNIPLEILKDDLGKSKTFLQDQQVTQEQVTTQKKDTFLLLNEEILAIAFFRKDYLDKLISEVEPDGIIEDLRALYKKVVIYYTNHQNLDKFLNSEELQENEKETWIRLSMFGEKNYANSTETDLSSDFENLIFRLKKQSLDEELRVLTVQLRQAESSGNSEETNNVSHRINIINKERAKLQR